MKTIGIIGLGLIGGSLARAFKKKSPDTIIIAANRSEEPLKKALAEGIIDHYAKTINESFSACEIIFICVPVGEAERVAEHLKKHTNKDTIVTDVGSTKESICGAMRKHRDSFTFIGGHPMAGSERSGYDASAHYLFENAYYLLTPYEDTPSHKLQKLLALIEKTGALPLILEPSRHDYLTAAISHAPHVIAMALVNAAARAAENAPEAVALASGGFKDITRIASSSPEMWSGISLQNRENILKILAGFKERLTEYENGLKEGNADKIRQMFENAKSFREEFSASRPRSASNVISVDLEDKPGGIAFVSAALAYSGINIKNIGIVNNRDFESGILEIVTENEADTKKGRDILQRNGFIVRE